MTSRRRVVPLVLGSVLAAIGLALLAAGASLGWALGTQRDDAGFFTTPTERLSTDTAALTSDELDLGQPDPDAWWAGRDLATVRITVDNADSRPVFVGIGPKASVEAYLAGVPHDDVIELSERASDRRRENAGGASTPSRPAEQTFWVAQASGHATRALTWDLEPGTWTIVVMNADASPGVAVDLELGGRIDHLVPLAIGLAIAGATVLVLGVAIFVRGARSGRSTVGATGPPTTDAPHLQAPPTAFVAHPVRLEGDLDPRLSRWRWLVKWFLAIPHFVVLAFLWAAFMVFTLVAFVAIVFTGRYPRRIFEFDVGVMRWSWRVTYYATSVLGTDRYPPFTVRDVEYPARLHVAYPERLSRRLVLVKPWLLAIPHLLIVWAVSSSGLLGLATHIAAVALLFTGRYPTGLYDLIMGALRWAYRLIAYVALMTDEYPPFRLDQGGSEPMGAAGTG
jgi:hypothetical protein